MSAKLQHWNFVFWGFMSIAAMVILSTGIFLHGFIQDILTWGFLLVQVMNIKNFYKNSKCIF